MDPGTADEFGEALSKRIVPTLKGDVWRACKGGYRIEGRGEERYLVPVYDINLESKWRTINLVEEQDLVLDFVKAFERGLERSQDDPLRMNEFKEPVLAFVGKYGLGINGDFRWAGGQEETLEEYVMMMHRIAPLVYLLEAVLSSKESEVQAALEKCPDARNFIASMDDLDLYLANGGEEHEMDPIEHALAGLGYVIASWFYELCRPFAIPEPRARRLSQMDAGWGFSSLTGAMFWHLFHLLAAQSRITRCKYCGSLIPNAHKNTKFCRNEGKCRNAYDNHSGRRAEREAARKRRESGIN